MKFKGLGFGLGYVIGSTVLFGLFLLGLNYFQYSGNRASEEEVKTYIENSKLETFTVYEKLLRYDYETYTVYASRRGGLADAKTFLFYDENYQKFFQFFGFADLLTGLSAFERIPFRKVETKTTFSGFINKAQLNNPEYGTKDNPIPVWIKEMTLFNNEEIHSKESDQVLQIFIKEYLSRFIPKEEYKEMFNK